MSYTLIGSFTSPFVRKLRLLLHDDASLKFIPVNYFEEAGNKYLRETSPFNQLPVLMDGDQPIYESRVMFNHIAKKRNLKPLTLDEENVLSAIDACLSSGVNLFSLQKGGIDIKAGGHYYIERQQTRMPSLLNFITPWAAKQRPESDWNFLTMSLFSALEWLQFRNIYDLKEHPQMIDFLRRFQNCPGVKETEIPPA